ncbi:WhiB family transcriptional regulator [Mycobacterium sp. CBMA226]|nr:WhiB family transcriptional regulator [Mycolicibacterium sp. CBMA 226]MUL79919.1 WhiB family transcriptional regulator [Mycolicibacterium sp. CBMA 226]
MIGKRTALPVPSPAIRPVADEWEWQESARCRTMDSSIFFHPDNERGRARRQREQQAKEICHQCPVKTPCAAFALLSGEPYGTWGGISESERLSALGISDPRTAGNLSTATRRKARRADLAAASGE